MPIRRDRTHPEARLHDLRFRESWKYTLRPLQKLPAKWILGSGEVVREPFVDGAVVQQNVSGAVGAHVDPWRVHEVMQRFTRDGDSYEQARKHVERQLPSHQLRHGCGPRARGVDHCISTNSLAVLPSQRHAIAADLDAANFLSY